MKTENDLLPGGKNDPFEVPEGFFEKFKSDLQDSVDASDERIAMRILRYTAKYAAVLCILFFAGKGMISTFSPEPRNPAVNLETGTEIDLIYMQISEQELTDYMTEELEEDLPYYTDF